MLTSKKTQNLNGLTNYLSDIKSIKMEEEYKVCWTKYHEYPQTELTQCYRKRPRELNLINIFIQAIPKGELHSCIEGKRHDNKSKNRYTTIFPCKFH